jgi:SNF2 family DNA or RNA helicase
MIAPRAYLEGSKICLEADFSSLLLCKRIPGGTWDAQRRLWVYPAAPRIARIIRATFRGAELSDDVLKLADRRARILPQDGGRRDPVASEPEIGGKSQTAPATIPNLKTRPWRHQVAAYEFLARLLQPAGGAALLAMSMGTGKSLVTVGAICNLVEPDEPAIVVGPLRVVDVWPAEIARHAGLPLQVVALGDDAGAVAKKTEKAAAALDLARVRGDRLVLVINYESVWRDPFAAWALKQRWGLVVYDEAHRLKQPSGKASMFAARLRSHARLRLALTGTPMPHSPLDIYALGRALDNRHFGNSFHAFKQSHAIMGGFQQKQVVGYRNLEQIEATMRQFTFRVGKDVLDLPPETHVTYHCTLSPEGMRAYRSLEKDYVAQIDAGLITAANGMVVLIRLQQITGGSVRLDDDRYTVIDDSKRKLLADTLEDIGKDEPVVVFCRFRSDLDAVHKAAADLGFDSMELSGRQNDLAAWQEGKAQVLAVQIQAGGVGINLTRARLNIYYSLSHSLGEYDQSLSRVHRPGQIRPVTHIHLVAKGTVDEKIMRALEQRAEVVESVLKQLKERE